MRDGKKREEGRGEGEEVGLKRSRAEREEGSRSKELKTEGCESSDRWKEKGRRKRRRGGGRVEGEPRRKRGTQ